jgi:galactokinase
VPHERVRAFAPGRVNLIGEHTDYNQGLALPFAITEGITVRAQAPPPRVDGQRLVEVHALDLGESDEFALAEPRRAPGWRAFVRGTIAELERAGFPLVPASLEIGGDVPPGAGLSSSAALEVALCLALINLGSPGGGGGPRTDAERTELARLCARVENEWVGARTGLLDQLASLFGAADTALRIDFRTLEIEPVALLLRDWRLAVLDTGERHSLASSGYNERRAECARACELLGVASLREADPQAVESLPEPLRLRARHVISENQRVLDAVAALRADDLPALGRLLNASHASLRDQYAVSTPAVEAAVEHVLAAGAAGARLLGGGFGGSVLGLFGHPSLSPLAPARCVPAPVPT